MQTYVARITHAKQRTLYFSLLQLAQVCSFIIGPIMAAMLSFLPTIAISQYPYVRIVIDEYTIVGYVNTVLCIVNIGILVLFFKDLPPVHKCK